MKIDYIREGIRAQAHTPVYKMHKYFARRPQNVFRQLAEHYSRPGDLILDVFCGGGVTLFEGLSAGRRVAACDINPLAVLISRMEVTKVDEAAYEAVMGQIRDEVEAFARPFYMTRNRETGELLPARWYEHAYQVSCSECGAAVLLSNERKEKRAGWYVCPCCGASFQGVGCERQGEMLLNVTYKVTTRKTQRTVAPDEEDLRVWRDGAEHFQDYVRKYDLWIPDIPVPEQWDRQQEDCLYRKGVRTFSDFFVRRSLLVMAYFLKKVRERKNQVPPRLYQMLLLTFSATLRYTSNLTISTSAWQDGRPSAWAKHAYWLSGQFVEVNPVEYLDKRITAMKAAFAWQRQKLPDVTEAASAEGLVKGEGDYFLWRGDACRLPLADESADLVLTDPPYGSNVQYGELTAFWLAWLYPDLGMKREEVTNLADEILVNRKQNEGAKDHTFYYQRLYQAFRECRRVLKDGRPLVFTFNNKDPRVWMAVMKAVLDAGFVLEPEGVIYQRPIEDYSNTAHAKYAGALQGDFIYTFVKQKGHRTRPFRPGSEEALYQELEDTVKKAILDTVAQKPAGTEEIYIQVLKAIIPILTSLALEQKNFRYAGRLFRQDGIEERIRALCQWDREEQAWKAR